VALRSIRSFFFRLSLNPLVIREGFLPQLFGIALFLGRQRTGRRPVTTWQAIEERT
jgi:hypothetical protein